MLKIRNMRLKLYNLKPVTTNAMFSFLYFLLLHFIFTSGPIRFDSFYYNTSIIQTRIYTYSPCVLVFSIKNIVHNTKKDIHTFYLMSFSSNYHL